MKKTIYLILAAVLIVLVFVLLNKGESKDEIRIGVISTLTGNAAYYGQSNLKGVELAKEELQKIYTDKKIVVYSEDSLFTPPGGLAAYSKLKNVNNVQAVVVQASNVAVAVGEVANKDNVMVVGASVLASAFRTPDDLSFRMTAAGGVEAEFAIEYMAKSNLKKLAIIYMKNEIGQTLQTDLNSMSPKNGITVLASEGYAADTTDFKTILSKVKELKPDIIYVAGLASHTATILKQSQELGIATKFMSYRAAEDPVLIKNAGSLAEGLLYTGSYDNAYAENSTDPKDVLLKSFVTKYVAKYNESPNSYAAEAYEGTLIAVEAIVKCAEDKVCQKDYIQSIKNRPTVLGNISLDTYGDVSYPFFMKIVKNGQFGRAEI